MQAINWNQMSELGLIQRINTEILHSLGLAISRNPSNGSSEAILVASDGVWEYGGDIKPVDSLTKEQVQSKLVEFLNENT